MTYIDLQMLDPVPIAVNMRVCPEMTEVDWSPLRDLLDNNGDWQYWLTEVREMLWRVGYIY